MRKKPSRIVVRRRCLGLPGPLEVTDVQCKAIVRSTMHLVNGNYEGGVEYCFWCQRDIEKRVLLFQPQARERELRKNIREHQRNKPVVTPHRTTLSYMRSPRAAS